MTSGISSALIAGGAALLGGLVSQIGQVYQLRESRRIARANVDKWLAQELTGLYHDFQFVALRLMDVRRGATALHDGTPAANIEEGARARLEEVRMRASSSEVARAAAGWVSPLLRQ